MGELDIIGIGPGEAAYLTKEAENALAEADVLCGYTLYVDLVLKLFPGKETHTTPMTKEEERCRWAIDQAAAGRKVALLSSGDAGVYGMAGLALQMASERPDIEIAADYGDTQVVSERPDIEMAADYGDPQVVSECPDIETASERRDIRVRVIPGITAAISGAALLGAPLMNDFCVLSLSDRLTPWEKIGRRLRAAAAGDLVMCLYNPASKGRPDHLRRAVQILLEILPPETVCGYVRNIGRSGTKSGVMTLNELKDFRADMFTTVFIGNSGTVNVNGKMITKRGYGDKP